MRVEAGIIEGRALGRSVPESGTRTPLSLCPRFDVHRSRTAFLCLLLPLLLSGCGHGGTQATSGLFYTGSQAAADLEDPAAATALLTQGYAAMALHYALAAFHRSLPSPALVDPAQVEVQATGSCAVPGRAVVRYRLDLLAGTLSGTVTWEGYCVLGRTLAGTARLTGTLANPPDAAPFYTLLSLQIEGVRMSTLAASYALQGTLTVRPGAPAAVEGNLFQRREATGEVVWIKDFLVEATADPSDAALRLQRGTLYDPLLGGADLRTLVLFLAPLGQPWPVNGQLQATNGTGIRAVLAAHLTAAGNETFTVDLYSGDRLLRPGGPRSWSALGL